MLKNPILKGFKPDPSILRVGDVYYIATSTFEWFPPINLFVSSDLSNWTQVESPIQSTKVLDLTGIDSSCGVWAPHLNYHDDTFYLVGTVVDTNRKRFKDPRNFIMCAPSIEGPWTEPIYLNNSGWDPSLFFDEDGTCYLINMFLDWRPDRNRFGGIILQKLNIETFTLEGKEHYLSSGSHVGSTEAPNIYAYGAFYYLFLAEGGTEFGHQVTVMRSSSLLGHYEECPHNPLLKSKPTDELQRAGHGSLVQTPEGRWYLAYLCSRSVERKYSILGRETALVEIIWNDDFWPVLVNHPDNSPRVIVDSLPEAKATSGIVYHDFKKKVLDVRLKTLRNEFSLCGIDLESNADALRIQGGNSLSSKFRQHFIAMSQESLSYTATTMMMFNPRSFLHLAGLVVYYNADNYYYAYQSTDEEGDVILGVVEMINKNLHQVGMPIKLPFSSQVYLQAVVRTTNLSFSYSVSGQEYTRLHDETLDMRKMSDEEIEGNGFTGAMVGIGCQDLAGDGIHADFAFLKYEVN